MRMISKGAVFALLLLVAWPACGQANMGQLRLRVTDPSGLGLKATVQLVSEANQYHKEFITNASGSVTVGSLHFGIYRAETQSAGFTSKTNILIVRSSVPVNYTIRLEVAPVTTAVKVSATDTLIDPYQPSPVMEIGAQQIRERVASLPGRSVQNLVNTQPGWLYEGNAVLHPRGSEYQTQFVVDGIPLTDNRSPGFGPEIDANELDSLTIYTAGIPAEYGRKLGGVIELNTKRNMLEGLHGQLLLSGGSYSTTDSFARLQDAWGRNALSGSASGSVTDHYLNPVVPENYTNRGTSGDFSIRYQRELAEDDHIIADVRHAFSRFEIPNEQIQQRAGQRQHGSNSETMGTVNYQHLFSPNVLGSLAGMVRDKATSLSSNKNSKPVLAFQDGHFREGYFKGTIAVHRSTQEWKAGIESDATALDEHFSYEITDPSRFDEDTPLTFSFAQSKLDLEQSAFVEDLVRMGNWTVSLGLRWDHYQLLLNRNALSPRLTTAYYVPGANMMVHFSYDRVFQTPSNENILLSSSPSISSLSPEVLRLPVEPSSGNYFELGVIKTFGDTMRFNVNTFRRGIRNFADDDQLLNTGVSYPISFNKAVIYGVEGKAGLVRLRKLNGFVSYSYAVGKVWFPVTGGLFLGDDIDEALQHAGHFPNSQDQRNTVRTRFGYQLLSRLRVASGLSYGSGLPFEYTGTKEEAEEQYGPQMVGRLNFARGRVSPSLSISTSLMANIYKSAKMQVRLQADADNLTNRLNVIDFGGLFSGNAIGPARSGFVRLNVSF